MTGFVAQSKKSEIMSANVRKSLIDYAFCDSKSLYVNFEFACVNKRTQIQKVLLILFSLTFTYFDTFNLFIPIN